jgi:hypothetical protein
MGSVTSTKKIIEVKKMKHMFIRYCQATEAWANATVEDRKNYYGKLKESAKKHGLDLVLFGPSMGVIESPAWVLKSEKSLDNYLNWLMSMGNLGFPRYFSASRTVTLMDSPWI